MYVVSELHILAENSPNWLTRACLEHSVAQKAVVEGIFTLGGFDYAAAAACVNSRWAGH